MAKEQFILTKSEYEHYLVLKSDYDESQDRLGILFTITFFFGNVIMALIWWTWSNIIK